MKKSTKKLLLYLASALLVSAISVLFYTYIPKKIESIDNTFRDYMFTIRGEIPHSQNIVIIDIDEKSLKQEGQWPWPRNKLAHLVDNLKNADVGIIGFDIIFAENDRISKDNDTIFSDALYNSPSILGYQFQFGDTLYKDIIGPNIPTVFIQKNKSENINSLLEAQGVLLNIPQLQTYVYSSGFVNNLPDETGITRSVPLIMQYNDDIYPSLALEIIRTVYNEEKVILNYDQLGLENIQIGDMVIPTDLNGRLLINYRGHQNSFQYLSATDIIHDKFNSKDIEGKIVLLGTSAAGLFDLRATPYDFVFPGVEIQANIIDNILAQDFLQKPSWIYGVDVTIIISIALVLTLILAYISSWLIPIVILVFLVGSSMILYKVLFEYGLVLNIFFIYFTIILTGLLALMHNYFFETKQNKLIKNKFANKVSKEVMQDLLENDNMNMLKGKQKEITIFFSDIRGFTSISEAIKDPEKLIEYLNIYMEPMTQIIVEQKGTVDKYIGDAIMAYWNAPFEVKNHADKALSAALKQVKQLEHLNVEYKQLGFPPIDIGIGLNTGLSIVGEMGSSMRSDYTIIGDSVNLASRIESLCKQYKVKIIISQFTKEELKEEYVIRSLDVVQVSGKNEVVEIYEVLDFGKADQELQEQLDLYHQALQLYRNAKFQDALNLFELLKTNDNTHMFHICEIYINRCHENINNPNLNFSAIHTHQSK